MNDINKTLSCCDECCLPALWMLLEAPGSTNRVIGVYCEGHAKQIDPSAVKEPWLRLSFKEEESQR